MRVLALDFDGVISDSALESFVVALRTYAALRPGGPVAEEAARLAGGPGDRVRGSALYRDFLEVMPLGNRAEDFGVALGLLDEGRRVDAQADFDAARRDWAPAALDDFHERFYRERAALRRVDPEAWAALLMPFAAIVALLRRRAGDACLCIATAKDRPSVDWLLERYGLAALFPAERVADKAHGRSKRAHLTVLRERLGVPFGAITFVDDKFNHLADVAPLGVRCALATWGYNGPRERRLAAEAGHLVCGVEDAEAKLFDA